MVRTHFSDKNKKEDMELKHDEGKKTVTCGYLMEDGNCKNSVILRSYIQHNGLGGPSCGLDNQELCLEYVREK